MTRARAHRESSDSINAPLTAVVPPKGIIMASLAAADVTNFFDGTGLGVTGGSYHKWAICNGNNGTPNLTDVFVRFSATAAGATGGSDDSGHTHGPGSFAAKIKFLAGSIETDEVSASWTSDLNATATGWTRSAVANARTEGSGVIGTSATSSGTDNRPAFHTLVALMRVA